jgi:hypothetical protein
MITKILANERLKFWRINNQFFGEMKATFGEMKDQNFGH